MKIDFKNLQLEIQRLLSAKLAGAKVPAIMISGSPGVGKTALLRQLADLNNIECKIVNLTTCDTVDVRGLPSISNNQTVFASPFPKNGKGILVLDELASATKEVQVACHHILQNEKKSDCGIGDGWLVVCTSNTESCETVYNVTPAPTLNRCIVFNVEYSCQDFFVYSEKNGIDHRILGFLKFKPDLLMFKKIEPGEQFPTPRAWENLSNILKFTERDAVMAGVVGDAAAIEFRAFLKMYNELPSVENIVNDPLGSKIPENIGVKYSATQMCIEYAKQNKASLFQYVERLGAEYAAMYIYKVRDFFTLKKCAHICAWVENNKEIFNFEN